MEQMLGDTTFGWAYESSVILVTSEVMGLYKLKA